MRVDEFDTLMRRFEWLGEAAVPPDAYIILRMDGKGFSKFTEASRLAKPVDDRMHALMCGVTRDVMEALGGIFATTHSDEISILLPADCGLYNREIAKLVSISAAMTASTFTRLYTTGHFDIVPFVKSAICFDSRVWCSENRDRVIDYFRWRQADALRCSLNGFAYWTMRKYEGLSQTQATKRLEGATKEYKNEILFRNSINFAELPGWQKNGVAFHWQKYEKDGFNPKTGETTKCERRKIVCVDNVPTGEHMKALLCSFALPFEGPFEGVSR